MIRSGSHSPRTAACGLLTLTLLAGCADVRLPRIVLDDGPAPAVGAAPAVTDPKAVLTGERPIRRADPKLDGFPNLASVPARPTAFSSPQEMQALFDRLQSDRAEATRTGEAVRTETPTPSATDEPRLPDAPPPVPQPIPR